MYYTVFHNFLKKKKIAWKCGSQLVIHITRHFNGVNELSDHFTRV